MSEINDGGLAFPSSHASQIFYPSDLPSKWVEKLKLMPTPQNGLTKREWFAGAALAALYTHYHYEPGKEKLAAKQAFEIADAMIQEAEVKP